MFLHALISLPCLSLHSIVGYLMPNPLYRHILNISFVDYIFKRAWALFGTQLNGFKYCYISHNLTSHLLAYIVCSIWLRDRTLTGATTPGLSGHRSNGNQGVLSILQSSSITGASPSDGLYHIQNTREESPHSAEIVRSSRLDCL